MDDVTRDRVLQDLLDRSEITDVVMAYASRNDRGDLTGLRAVFTDDARALLGNEWLVGGDHIVRTIVERTAHFAWQHHHFTVAHVELHGDTASVLVYCTSHQATKGYNDIVRIICSRYDITVARTAQGWRVAVMEMELLWREHLQKIDAPPDPIV